MGPFEAGTDLRNPQPYMLEAAPLCIQASTPCVQAATPPPCAQVPDPRDERRARKREERRVNPALSPAELLTTAQEP